MDKKERHSPAACKNRRQASADERNEALGNA